MMMMKLKRVELVTDSLSSQGHSCQGRHLSYVSSGPKTRESKKLNDKWHY